MKVSDGNSCIFVSTISPSFTRFKEKLTSMSQKQRLNLFKGAVISMTLWMPGAGTSIMRKDGVRTSMAFKIEATDFVLVDVNPTIQLLRGVGSRLPLAFDQEPSDDEEDMEE